MEKLFRKDFEDLGWQVDYDAIVLVAYLSDFKAYYSDSGLITIHKCQNDCLEFKIAYKGRVESKEELKQIMEDNKI